MLRKISRIIVSRTDRIGDVVLSLPVFASLKECFPESELTAFVREYTADVASSFRAVDGVTTYDTAESFFTTVKKLRRLRADAILFLYPRFQLSAAAFLARIPVRVGTAYRWYSFLFNTRVFEHRKDSIKSEAEYNLSIAEAIGCKSRIFDTKLEIDQDALQDAKQFLVRRGIEKFVVVHPGSGGSAADWRTDNFRSLCKAIAGDFNLRVIVTGSDSEQALCTRVSEGIGNCLNAAGEFSLREFIAFLSLSSLFVSNSTGPIHLAASVGVPVIGIYPNNRPMTPSRWAPITDRRKIITPSDGSDDLAKIAVHEVLEAIRVMLPVDAE